MYGIYDNGNVIAQFTTPLTVKSNIPIFVSDTLSLSRHVTSRTAQRWEIETGVEPLYDNAQTLLMHLLRKGYSTSFTVKVPQNVGAVLNTTASGSALATGAVGTTQVAVTGLLDNISEGLFITFANHSKVYMVSANLSGPGALNIYPSLQTAVSGTTLNYTDVFMQCFYDTDVVMGMHYSDGILMDLGTIKLVEAV